MPAMLWDIYWLYAQGYDVPENILYQYNKSAIILENNGQTSSRKHTKHKNIRYYFVTNSIEKYELSLEWFTTGYMIGYFMTKPNQGVAFKRFQYRMMVVTEAQEPVPGHAKIDREYQVSEYDQKAARNVNPAHK